MFNLKKTVALLSTTLLLLQGVPGMLATNNRAEAVTWRPAIQGIMSHQYPIYWGNQFHSDSIVDSTFRDLPRNMDVITINKANDLFVDHGATTALASKLKSTIPGVKVLQYLNLMDVWGSSDAYQWMKNNNAFLRDDSGNIIHPYHTSQRWAGDPTKSNWQDYWANRAASICNQGMDGIFSDNWWRSNAEGWKISSSRFTNIEKGWNTMGQKAKSKMGSKILLGNGPAFGMYQSRDMAMIEMRNSPSYFNEYLKLSDEARSYGQGNLDVIQPQFNGSDFMHSYSSITTFSLPACLLTDNVFGFSNNGQVFRIIKQVGKVGYPKGTRYSWNGILRRDFTGGVVLFNNTSGSKTLSVPSGLKDIYGSSVSKVTLGSKRGIILKGSSSSGSTASSLAAPSNLASGGVFKGSTSGDYYVKLSWKDNSSNESGFKIYKSINSTSNFQEIKTTSANLTTYDINVGKTTGTYYFKVAAYNDSGNSSYSNTISVNVGSLGTSTGSVPASPSNLVVTNIYKGATSGYYYVDLDWKDNSNNESGFKILRSLNSTSNFQEIKTVGANASKYNVCVNKVTGTYYFKVVAYNGSGNSSPSNTVTANVH